MSHNLKSLRIALLGFSLVFLTGCDGDDEGNPAQPPTSSEDSRAISQAELDDPKTSLDPVSPNTPVPGPQVSLSEGTQTTRQEAKHFRSVLTLEFGEEKFLPGDVFHIVPQKDEIITGNCRLKFDCQRLTGSLATKYRVCTWIVFQSGRKSLMQSAFVQVNGHWTNTPIWPASQAEKEIEFPVSFDPGLESISGTGWVYFFLDDGSGEVGSGNPWRGKVLSNIISIEGNVPKK